MIVQGSREGPRLTDKVILSNIFERDLFLISSCGSLNNGRTRQVLGNAGADRKQWITGFAFVCTKSIGSMVYIQGYNFSTEIIL